MLHLNETEEKIALLARLLAETDFKILPKTEKQSLLSSF
jgi:hypothetical protein